MFRVSAGYELSQFLLKIRKHEKIYSSFILSLFISLNVNAQVAGISASKLTTYNAYTIDRNYLEIEPSFFRMSSRSAFNDHGTRYFYSANRDSLIISSALFLRGTYSPFKKLEIGTFITSDLSSLSLGLKYMFLIMRCLPLLSFTAPTGQDCIRTIKNPD